MKRGLFLSMSTFVFATVNANTYYFTSNSGDYSRPSAEAQNPSITWKIISKLNGFFSSLLPRHAVLYRTLTMVLSHGEIQHMDDIEEVEAKKFYVSLYRSYTG